MASRKRAAQADEYESDGGFVEDAPRSKKMKATSGKTDVSTDKQIDDEGNPYWELSGKRRLQVTSFKGSTFVGIREFYEKDGKSLPGKKGISLSIDQYATFIELLPQIEAALKAKDIDVPRPEYDKEAEDPADKDEMKRSREQSNSERLKKNHEATSDEDEDD